MWSKATSLKHLVKLRLTTSFTSHYLMFFYKSNFKWHYLSALFLFSDSRVFSSLLSNKLLITIITIITWLPYTRDYSASSYDHFFTQNVGVTLSNFLKGLKLKIMHFHRKLFISVISCTNSLVKNKLLFFNLLWLNMRNPSNTFSERHGLVFFSLAQ